MTNPLLRPFTDRQLVNELIERRLVVEAWVTARFSDVELSMMKYDWRKMVDETNIGQLVYCEPFTSNLRRRETVDGDGSVITHTILILKATEETRDITNQN